MPQLTKRLIPRVTATDRKTEARIISTAMAFIKQLTASSRTLMSGRSTILLSLPISN